MIEPIGLVGTLLAILQVSAKLVTTLYEFRSAAKGARREVALILDEITSVRNIVEKLVIVAEDANDTELETLKWLGAPDAALQTCLQQLVDIKQKLEIGGKWDAKLLPVKWPLKQKDLEQRLAALSRMKTTLQLALDTDNVQNMLKILASTKSIPTMSKQLTILSQTAEDAAQKQERQEFFNKLGGQDQTVKHQQHYHKRSEGTGNWLLGHPAYLDWRRTGGRSLWLNGIAGSGKTVLCANVIQDLRSHCSLGNNSALAFFYIDGSDREALSIDIINRTILQQVCSQRDESAPSLSWYTPDEYEDLDSGRSASLFWRLIQDLEHLYIVIDGLDECYEQIDVDTLIDFLHQLQNTSVSKIHTFLSSRNLEQIRQKASDIEATSLTIEHEASSEDMHLALEIQIFGNSAYKKWPKALREEIRKSISANAHGSFYYLTCQLASLNGCMTLAAVRSKLRNLPKTLEDHYLRELTKYDEVNGHSIRNALRWTALSLRPLSVSEFANAVAINTEDDDQPCLDENLELLDVEGFLDSCSSLLTTYRKSSSSESDQNIFVKFTHFTVLEFIRSDAILASSGKRFALEQRMCQSSMAKACLVYLQQVKLPSDETTAELYPLFEYAAQAWLQHKILSRDEDWSSQDAQNLILPMFAARSVHSRNWLQTSLVDKPWLYHLPKQESALTPLYCAAYAGLTDIVVILLQTGVDPNGGCGVFGNPLQAAAVKGHHAIVTILVEANADVNVKGGKYQTAIAGAAALGHEKTVKVLLDAKADIQPSRWGFGDRRDDPLFLAASNGQLDTVKLLLQHGAEDYHAMKANPCTALHAAVQIGRLDIVKVMLQNERVREVNMDSMRGIIRPYAGGILASQYSSAKLGHKGILRELLSYGISDGDAFRYAARVGDEDLFYEYLPKIESIDEEGRTSDHPRALCSAIQGRHTELVRVLLSKGAKPDGSALVDSVNVRDIEIAKLLIQAGAASMIDDWPGPLSSAIHSRQRNFMELFVQHGASVLPCLWDAISHGNAAEFRIALDLGGKIEDLTPENNISVLQGAAFGGSVDIVQHLLDEGLQVNDRSQTSPLVEALRCGHRSVVELLMSNGADVNAQPTIDRDPGRRGGVVIHGNIWPPLPASETLLSYAIQRKDEKLVYTLIEKGSEVSPSTRPTVGTPLLFAIWEQMTGVVESLLKGGASPNQSGTIKQRPKPIYPLMLAAEKGSTDVMSLLIDAGANIDQQDEEGFSALHITCAHPDTDGLNLMIHEWRANITPRLKNGSQPIHSAASKGTAKHVAILLDAGADINATNDAGRTALHWAAVAGNFDTIDLLLERGADANLKADSTDVTPIDLLALEVERLLKFRRKEDAEKLEKRASSTMTKLREAMASRTN